VTSVIHARRLTATLLCLALLALPGSVIAGEGGLPAPAKKLERIIRDLHPDHPAGLPIYHDFSHSRLAGRLTYSLARKLNATEPEAIFLSQVALLHDIDPERRPGTPARVSATIKALYSDFFGVKPLKPGFNGSVLSSELGWDRAKLDLACALIKRTTYPFDHGQARQYGAWLRRLPKESQAFALRWGATLSEYGDKSSLYLSTFARAHRAVEGLVNELNTARPPEVNGPRLTVKSLPTDRFLRSIGTHQAFAQDFEVAADLGFSPRREGHWSTRDLGIPGRRLVFNSLLPAQGRHLTKNIARFKQMLRK
jgi:hypothetical protein